MNKKYWVAFSALEIDSTFIQRLYNYFGDIETAYNAALSDLEQIDELSVVLIIDKFTSLQSRLTSFLRHLSNHPSHCLDDQEQSLTLHLGYQMEHRGEGLSVLCLSYNAL